jgi:hypothetical protein
MVIIILSFCPFALAKDTLKSSNSDFNNVSVTINIKESFGDLNVPLQNPDEILKRLKTAIEKKYPITINEKAIFNMKKCMKNTLMNYDHIAKLSIGCNISEIKIEFSSKTKRAHNFASKTDRTFENPSLKTVIMYDCNTAPSEFTCEGHNY